MKTGRPSLGRIAALALVLAGAPSAPAGGPDDLAARIDEILDRPGLQRVQFSACVVRADSGEMVYERNPRLALIPASNMKIITTAGALERLGPEFAFVTRVGLSGDALVVIGSGDPLFGIRDFEAGKRPHLLSIPEDIAGRLAAAGVTALSEIRLDVSVFDGERVHPGWPANQLNQKYACEVCGLNYRGNCADVVVSIQDGEAVLDLIPATNALRLINAVNPRPSGRPLIRIDRTGLAGERRVSGTCRDLAGPYAFAVENPALFFGRLLKEHLERAGIAVTGRILEGEVSPAADFRVLTELRTPLRACLETANKDSLGLAAEALFKLLGAKANGNGKGGSWDGGRSVLSDYLRGLGVGDDEFVISDGSGLSRDNRLSAWALTRVLLRLLLGPDGTLFASTLAVGGLDGTIEDHFWEPAYRGRVRAKSGYLRAVRALSGVVRTDGGEYVFSFLANKAGNGARQAIDAAVKAVADWAADPAPAVAPSLRPAATHGVSRNDGA